MRATYQQLLVIFIFSLVRILSAEANGHSSLLSNHLRTLSTDHHDSITPHDLDGESQEQDGRVGNVHKYYRMQSARRLATASVSKTPSKSTSLSRTSSRTPTPSRSFSQSSGASPSSTPTISVSATGTLSPLSQAGKGNSASAASSGAVLGTSGVIGVSVAVVLGTLLVCGIVVYFVLKRYNNHKSEPQRAWGHAISDGSGTSPREMRASPAWRTAQHAPLGTHRQSDVLLAPSDAHIGSDTPMHASQLDRADAQQVHPVSVTQPIGAHDWHELPEPADAQDALRELRALQAEIQRIQYQRDRGVSPPPDPYEQAVPAELLLGRRARVVGAASHTSSLSSNSIVVTSVNEEPAVPHSRDSDAGSDAVTLCPDVLADYVKDARAADIVAMQHVIDAEIQRRERDLKVVRSLKLVS